MFVSVCGGREGTTRGGEEGNGIHVTWQKGNHLRGGGPGKEGDRERGLIVCVRARTHTHICMATSQRDSLLCIPTFM